MLCNAGYGIGPAKSIAGGLKRRNGSKAAAPSSRGPVKQHRTPHILCRWYCSGNGGPGGTVMKANQQLTSSDAERMKSCQKLSRSAATSRGHRIGPPYTV